MSVPAVPGWAYFLSILDDGQVRVDRYPILALCQKTRRFDTCDIHDEGGEAKTCLGELDYIIEGDMQPAFLSDVAYGVLKCQNERSLGVYWNEDKPTPERIEWVRSDLAAEMERLNAKKVTR